ncbi:hypothetical protein AeRB84_013995 [Aphanomyces euteiches]|nr:hypothetical protein AeRB84_013995 [Aphanomyces euteiches]
MTAVLTIRADGGKLPILFVIKGCPGGIIETEVILTFPDGHVYAVQQRAWMNGRISRSYLESVFAPNVEGPSLMLVDNFHSHVTDESFKFVQEDCGSHLVPLPANSTSHCQPLDVAIMGPFKQHLHDLFLRETNTANTCQEKRLVMIKRAIQAWEMITKEEIQQSFVKALPKPVEESP